jgi:hypothetical protein
MELTAVRTGSGVFRVHRAGCDDIAKDVAQGRGAATNIEADSREAVIRMLWADVIGGGSPGAFRSCAGRTDFIGCTWGLPATSQA